MDNLDTKLSLRFTKGAISSNNNNNLYIFKSRKEISLNE